MDLANAFYRYPRLTFLVFAFIMVTGFSAMQLLARQEDPAMAERYATLFAYLPGASADRMESLVAEKIERKLLEIPELKTLHSSSRDGNVSFRFELDDSVPPSQTDLVWSDVRDKINDVEPELPAGTWTRFEIRGPLAITLAVALQSDNAPLSVLTRLADELESRLTTLPGTKRTEIFGESEEEILVEANSYALSRAGISMRQLAAVIASSDTRVASGTFEGDASSLLVEVKGELDTVERIRGIPVPVPGSQQFLRVADLATVKKHFRDPPETIALVSGRQAVVVTTQMEPGRRVDQWSDRAKAIVAEFERELPGQVKLEIIADQNYYTDERLSSLVVNLGLAVLLVLLILLLFMGIRSALIVALSLPLTLAMVLAGLHFLDIPLHQLSVTGLIIALGLLIDNAIVVVEEYRKERFKDATVSEAISESIRHLFVPLLASTATTIMAFLPITLTPGGVGDFTGDMAVAVVLSVGSSFLLAMTIVPSVAGYIDRRFGAIERGENAPWYVDGLYSKQLSGNYRRSLEWALAKPSRGILCSLVLPLVGFLAFSSLTKTFFPPVDRNQFQVQLTLPSHTPISETLAATQRAREILHDYPQVVESHWFIGESAPQVFYNMIGGNEGVGNFANAFVTTADVDDPRRILADVQRNLMEAFPSARVLALPFEQGPPVDAPVEVRLLGPELAELRRLGNEVRLVLSQIEGVTYTDATLSSSTPRLTLYPDENRTSLAGLSKSDLPHQIRGELSGEIAGAVMEGRTEIPIRVRSGRDIRSDLTGFSSIPITSQNQGAASGATIPLEDLADIKLEPATSLIRHYQGQRVNNVKAYLMPYAIPSVVMAQVNEQLAAGAVSLPEGYRLEIGGEQEERSEAVGKIMSTFVMFLFLMMAVIVMSLNSFRQAGIIGLVGLLSVGLAIFGVWLSGFPMGYMALIGTLGLVGLAINGAIIVLSALKANDQVLAGKLEPTVQVVMDSTRHILGTTATTIAGFLPLIIFGGHFWPPLAMAIAGGVAGSAILALYFVPAMFLVINRRQAERRIALAEPSDQPPPLQSAA